MSNDPNRDPRLSPAELALIRDGTRDSAGASRLPLARLLRSPAIWSMFAAHFATTWTLYVLISWLPSYFREAQGLDIGNSRLYSSTATTAT